MEEVGLLSNSKKGETERNKASVENEAKLRRYLSWSVAVLCAVVIVFGLILKEVNTSTKEQSEMKESRNFECTDYSDDSVYTNATCGSYDRAACNELCTDAWCLELCEDACASGAGAICATSYLSEVYKLCHTLDWANLPTRSLEGTEPYGHIGNNDINKADASGCDHHVYCLYCDHTCRSLLRHDTVQSSLGKLHGDTSVGPHSMNLLARLPDICEGNI